MTRMREKGCGSQLEEEVGNDYVSKRGRKRNWGQCGQDFVQ